MSISKDQIETIKASIAQAIAPIAPDEAAMIFVMLSQELYAKRCHRTLKEWLELSVGSASEVWPMEEVVAGLTGIVLDILHIKAAEHTS